MLDGYSEQLIVPRKQRGNDLNSSEQIESLDRLFTKRHERQTAEVLRQVGISVRSKSGARDAWLGPRPEVLEGIDTPRYPTTLLIEFKRPTTQNWQTIATRLAKAAARGAENVVVDLSGTALGPRAVDEALRFRLSSGRAVPRTLITIFVAMHLHSNGTAFSPLLQYKWIDEGQMRAKASALHVEPTYIDSAWTKVDEDNEVGLVPELRPDNSLIPVDKDSVMVKGKGTLTETDLGVSL